ncbi:bifunctional diaminohydroxyphosphoribosylaminopyrimidine deaminase/5-amino-6-(5-phosphoribosylamino)uracil reductase RibD [Nibrella viscosa]|uniref:Riboflavin biosynthesis protein RibD n=2 Tax=Nibrella viscosa TaxID=1084524 RepID=A0ABP8KKG1_9BACT
MQRALELATLGRGAVSPNPLVGCVIVHEAPETGPRIIGEGWHQRYGEPHAEVNAMRSVAPYDEILLPDATVYVTLEPCAHFGKTPPCADLLVAKQVKRVVVCNDDPFPLVAGKGLDKLRAAGIAVETGMLAKQGRELNQRFFTFVEKQRPYIILKWAETADGYIAGPDYQPLAISGSLSRRLVHRWRAEEDAIMVGTNTARHDNPQLNVRLWQGRNPVRVVIDKQLALPSSLHLFDNSQTTLVYNLQKSEVTDLTTYVRLAAETEFLPQLVADLYQRRIQSVLVEGGTVLLQSFMDAGLWDEIRVFRSRTSLGVGIKAPAVQGRLVAQESVGEDELRHFRPA